MSICQPPSHHQVIAYLTLNILIHILNSRSYLSKHWHEKTGHRHATLYLMESSLKGQKVTSTLFCAAVNFNSKDPTFFSDFIPQDYASSNFLPAALHLDPASRSSNFKSYCKPNNSTGHLKKLQNISPAWHHPLSLHHSPLHISAFHHNLLLRFCSSLYQPWLCLSLQALCFSHLCLTSQSRCKLKNLCCKLELVNIRFFLEQVLHLKHPPVPFNVRKNHFINRTQNILLTSNLQAFSKNNFDNSAL